MFWKYVQDKAKSKPRNSVLYKGTVEDRKTDYDMEKVEVLAEQFSKVIVISTNQGWKAGLPLCLLPLPGFESRPVDSLLDALTTTPRMHNVRRMYQY